MDKEFLQQFFRHGLVKNNQDTKGKRQEPMPLPEKPVPEGAKVFVLPEPDIMNSPQVDFLEVIECRSTERNYLPDKLNLQELSYLLWCTQGVKELDQNRVTKRNVPSAGSRHAFETYLYIDKVEGLPPGLYRFLALGHALLPVDLREDVKERVEKGFNRLNMFRESAVTFIWVAELERMEYLFGGRALQYLYIDAGHVCQNLYLAGYTIDTGVCAVGHFNDEEINKLLDLNGIDEFVVYTAHAGKVGGKVHG